MPRTAQWTLSVSVMKTSQFMLCSEIIAVCSQIHTKHINTLCGQNVECRTYRAVNTLRLSYKNQPVNAYSEIILAWYPRRKECCGWVVPKIRAPVGITWIDGFFSYSWKPTSVINIVEGRKCGGWRGVSAVPVRRVLELPECRALIKSGQRR